MATNVNLLDYAPDVVATGLRWVLAPLEDPTGLDRPLWRDLSRYQGVVDALVAKRNGVLGMASRSSISWGYQDSFFQRNYDEFGAHYMYRTSYHVPYPDQPVLRQADNWYKMHPEIDVIPRVIDLELQRGCWPEEIADFTWRLSELILSRDGVRPIIYSRKYLIDKWLLNWTTDMLNQHYWWLAQYVWDRVREHPGPPSLPNRVQEDRVILHQTADKKPGFDGEVESRSVDWDRWELGNAMQMADWIEDKWANGNGNGPGPIEPVEPVKIVRVRATSLNIRSQPAVESTDLGELRGETVVPVVDIEGVWYRIDGWIHSEWTKEV